MKTGMNIDEQSNTDMDNLSNEQVEILEKLKEKLKKPEFLEAVNLMAADRATVKEKTSKVNSVIDRITHQSIGDINTLLLAGANVVAEMMGKKKGAKKDQQEHWWKRRMSMKIGDLRKDISKLDQWKRGKLGKEGVKNSLEQTHHVRKRGLETVIEELKQRVKATAPKIRKYEERNNQFMQNRLFQTNQKRLFDILKGKEKSDNITLFWQANYFGERFGEKNPNIMIKHSG